MRIYTRSGDRGMTSIRGGKKVSKTDIRIEANGSLDELNACLGVLRAILRAEDKGDKTDFLLKVQSDLMSLMSLVATPYEERKNNPRRLSENAVEELERKIDAIQESGVLTQHFVLPSGTVAGATAHYARTLCRRAERALWRLDKEDPVGDEIMSYVNRLSDYLFALAREINAESGFQNEIWSPFNVIHKEMMKMEKLRPIMLGGTGSDVGKSVLAAGLCRIFRQDGYQPAPFKAQNMALNSYVTPDGLEIGRAQAAQAAACGIECLVEMNPVLLKPSGDMMSQVVVNGRPEGNRSAYGYFQADDKSRLRKIAHEAFDRLAARYNPMVMEGAGSIAELNLKQRDIVNMSMADYADAKVILVADIDRGGVFASVYGSVMLQDEKDRKRIAGVIINKFRGDLRLFDEGRIIIEKTSGIPVLGVMPYLSDIHIEEEDSVSLQKKNSKATAENLVNVAVVAVPHISNFTDFDSLSMDSRVHLYFTSDPEELRKAEIVILPGSKNTISDLESMNSNGCRDAVLDCASRGATVFGICGGYQMMGECISDPDGVEGECRSIEGLGLLPVKTVLSAEKRIARTDFSLPGSDTVNKGYEIHVGVSERDFSASREFAVTADGEKEGCRISDRIMGTYLHGCLDNSEVIDLLVSPYSRKRGLGDATSLTHDEYMNLQYDRLAEEMRKHIDIDRIYEIMRI